MRVFRDSYKTKDGERRSLAKWKAEFTDHLGTRRRITAFTDKKASEALGRRLERLVGLKVAGEQPDAEMRRWLEGLPNTIRTRLAKIGLLDSRSVASARPLRKHVDDYGQALLDKGDAPKHVRDTIARLKAICEGTHVTFLTEVAGAAVARYLAECREKGISPRTSNAYLTAIKGLFRWLIRERRATDSPVAHLDRVNEEVDRRRTRRALEPDELSRLVSTAHNGTTRHGMTGPERALAYRSRERNRIPRKGNA